MSELSLVSQSLDSPPLDDLALRERVRVSLQALYVEELVRAVRSARLMGARWKDIGQALGVSAQAVHKRFRWLDSEPVTVRRDVAGKVRLTCTRTGAVVTRTDLDRADLGRGALADLRARGLVDFDRLCLPGAAVVDQVLDDDGGDA